MPSRASLGLKIVRRTGRALRDTKQALRRSALIRNLPRKKVEFVDAAGNVTVSVVKAPKSEGIVQKIVSWYMNALVEHPIRTNAITQGCLCGLGDGIAQACEWRLDVMSPGKSSYNFLRTARMAAYGFFVAGPIYSASFRLMPLDRLLLLANGC